MKITMQTPNLLHMFMALLCSFVFPIAGFGQTVQADIEAVTASSYQSPNSPDRTIDGSTSTRWSAYDTGEWIEYELSELLVVDSIDIAFFHGDERVTYFDIEVSTDGTNWTTLLSGAVSGGTSEALESFDLTDTAALYVRYVGGGNSNDLWNSLTEVEIYVTDGDAIPPSAPTGLASSNVTNSTVDLDWNASTDNVGVAGYSVYTNGANPIDVAGTSVTVAGLDPATGYTFTVSAYDEADNESAPSSGVNVTTASGGSPLIFEDFASGASGFTVVSGGTWSAASGAYVLSSPSTSSPVPGNGNIAIHNTGVAGDWILTVDGSTTATSSDWNDFSIIFGYQDDENYYFVSFCESNDGNTSGVFRVVSGSGSQLADITATIAAEVVYAVEIEKSGSGYTVKLNDSTVATASDSTYVSGQVGLGSRNDGATFDNLEVVAPGGGDTVAPSTPTGLDSSNVTVTSVDLSWNASSDDVAVTGYFVYVNGSNPTSVTGTATTIGGLVPNTSYSFTVSAYDAASNESNQSSAEVVSTLADTTDPSVPTGLIASNVTTNSVGLSWNASTDDVGVTGYKVYTGGSGPVSVAGTSVNMTGLDDDTAYTFTVSAVDGAGNESSQSSGINVTTESSGMSGWPDASNTGYVGLGLSSGDLTSAGSFSTTSNGQVIENLNCSQITVKHNNVTIRGCLIHTGLGAVPVKVNSGVYGLLIEYCEIHQDLSQGGDRNGVSGNYNVPSGQTRNVVRRCNIHHTADGGKGAGGWVYEYNYIHPEVKYGSSHNDGVQVTKTDNSYSPAFIFRGNRVVMGSNFGNACLWISNDSGDLYDLLIEDNWLQGCSSTDGVELEGKEDKPGEFLGTSTIINNKVVQGWNDGPRGSGIRLSNAGTTVRSGNRYIDVNGNDLGSAD